MKRHVLLIGGGQMQLPVLSWAKKLDLAVVCFDGNPQALARASADYFVVCDIKDKDACLLEARRHRQAHRLDGVLTVGTDFSTTVAWIAEHLGLPGIPYAHALQAKDKGVMRACFQAHGVASPHYVVLEAPAALTGALPFALPAVVKPTDNMGARGVQLVERSADLASAISLAATYSLSGRVIIEEYIDGPEFSLDAIVRDGEVYRMGLADRSIILPPYFVEIGHSFPSLASPEVQEALWAEFTKGVQALGIRWGAAKGDVKFSSRGAVIGEIAARLSGGYMSGWTYPLSSGRSSILWALQNALGEALSPQNPELNQPVLERAWISLPGQIQAVRGLEAVLAWSGVEQVFLTVAAGDLVQFPTNNVEKSGNLIVSGSSRAAAEEIARQARNSLRLELVAPHPATDEFLWGSSPSPWWFAAAEPLVVGAPDSLAGVRLHDVYGNTPEDLLRLLAAESITPQPGESNFWRALLKGGLQGVRYYAQTRHSGMRHV